MTSMDGLVQSMVEILESCQAGNKELDENELELEKTAQALNQQSMFLDKYGQYLSLRWAPLDTWQTLGRIFPSAPCPFLRALSLLKDLA